MPQRWKVELDGAPHIIELGDSLKAAMRALTCDGTEQRIPKGGSAGPASVTFVLSKHEASVTMRAVQPDYLTRFRRALVAGLLGGYGRAGATQRGIASLRGWVIWELVVDGVSKGSWVACLAGGEVDSWVFVKPGGRVPQPGAPDWRPAGEHRPKNEGL